MSETNTVKSISEMSVSEIMAHLASIKDAEVKRLKDENALLAAKIAANNAEIVKITGQAEAKSGSKVSRKTKDAIVAVLSGGNLMEPPAIADAICAGSIFNKDGLDRKMIVLYVHNALNDDKTFVKVDNSYGLVTQ